MDETKRKWMKRAAATFAILFAIWVVYVICAAYYWQQVIGKPLERELGFQHGTPYITEDGSSFPRWSATRFLVHPKW
jgi:hypothetical protein